MLQSLRQNHLISLLLAFSILFLSVQSTVNAAIVGTSDIVAEQQSNIDREYLLNSLDREEVQTALIDKGVDLDMAKKRVASMTDEEIYLLNKNINEQPAGSGILGTIGFIFVVLLITDLTGVTDVFPFIKK